ESPWALLASQFTSPLVALLLAACALSLALGEVGDAIAIGAIVVLNAAVGFFQEHRAERALAALRSLTAPRARVVRDGRSVVIAAAEVVPEDLLVLEPGDVVAADATLLESNELRTSEALLTGESAPVEKSIDPAPAGAPLAEQRHQVFLGTSVAAGTALARVTGTGMRTEMGKIAHLLATARSGATPLQERLRKVSHTLLFLCLGVVAV